MSNRTSSRTRRANSGQPKLAVVPLEDRTVPTTLVGLTLEGALITFDSSAPNTIVRQVQVSGLRGGDQLIGIDYRPATGQLYGVGSGGRLYTLNPNTGAATIQARLTADAADTTNPFAALEGRFFGVDFNPTVDRLRVVSNTGQNLRINVDTGATTTDTPLNYAGADPNAGRTPGVVGSAYENPDNNPATGTVLYGIDASLDVLVTQAPPNDGTLNTRGSLGVNTSPLVGFDIDTTNTGFASLGVQVGGRAVTNLYTVNLGTGAATLVGRVGGGNQLRDVAAVLPSEPVFAVTAGGNLIGFNAPRPDLLTSKVAISGLRPGETITSIDFRPATGQLFGLGSTGRLYVIAPVTGVARRVVLTADSADTTNPFAGFQGTAFGFDFNPAVDRLRVVSDADQNLRTNVDTGRVLTDGTLAYAGLDLNAGADPNVVASAYTNNVVGATTTVLYGIDSDLDVLVRQAPPNDGTLNTVGAGLGVDVGDAAGFDISSNGTAYAAFNLPAATSTGFYTIDLTTGAATLRGTIGGGEVVVGLAVARPVTA